MVVCERFLVGREKYKIEAILIDSGRDLTLWIGGGTSPHVGAIALGIPRPSLEDPDITSASVSVLCLTGHKEDDWARKLAHHLAKEFNKPIVVTLGIHIDNITCKYFLPFSWLCFCLLFDSFLCCAKALKFN